MATSAITTYLNDHLGGSAAAVELLDRLLARSSGPEETAFFTTLRAEIEDDRSTLSDLINRFGGSPSGVRELGGWLAAKVASLKLRFEDTAGGDLELLESLEALVIGIHGKSRLWRALSAAAAGLPELQAMDFAALERRADEQHARVETRRVAAARRALVHGEDERS